MLRWILSRMDDEDGYDSIVLLVVVALLVLLILALTDNL